MNPKGKTGRKVTMALAMGLGFAVLVSGNRASAQDKPAPRKKPELPPTKMKLEEVFISQNYCLVDIRFYDSQDKAVSVKSGTFLYWSNFLKDKRKPQSKRKFDVSQVSHHKAKYTLKLPGVGKVCPPRIARLKITFTSKTPRLRFVKNWKKKATCH